MALFVSKSSAGLASAVREVKTEPSLLRDGDLRSPD